MLRRLIIDTSTGKLHEIGETLWDCRNKRFVYSEYINREIYNFRILKQLKSGPLTTEQSKWVKRKIKDLEKRNE